MSDVRRFHPTIKARNLYSNSTLQTADGRVLCRVGFKQAMWYVQRGLGTVVGENPLVVRLNFEPGGPGAQDDPYLLADKTNRCVVCGSEEHLTRHHTVPRLFRQHFPPHLKQRDSYDVLQLCSPCHSRYEIEANRLTMELVTEVSQRLGQTIPTSWTDTGVPEWLAYRYASTLVADAAVIPPERQQVLREKIRDLLGSVPDDLAEFVERRRPRSRRGTPHGRIIVENCADLHAFILRWRQHFVDTMQPQFLPPLWRVDRIAGARHTEAPGGA